MKINNPIVFAFALKSAIFFSPFLLSVQFANAQTAPSSSSAVTPTPALPYQNQEELAQLPQQQQIQEVTPSEVAPGVSSNTTLLYIWLFILTLLPVAVIASLVLFRRAVIRAIVNRAMQQLQGIAELENELTTVKQKSELSIQEVQNITYELVKEVEALKQKIGTERENLALITDDAYQSKEKFLTELETQINTSKQEVKTLASALASQFSELQVNTQAQKDISFGNLRKLEAELARQLSEIQSDVQIQKGRILENLQKLLPEFTSQLTALQSETQQRKDVTLENLQKIELEFADQLSQLQAEAEQRKDASQENIQQLESELSAQVLEFQTETEQRKNTTL